MPLSKAGQRWQPGHLLSPLPSHILALSKAASLPSSSSMLLSGSVPEGVQIGQ
jgi:hypothetical protein